MVDHAPSFQVIDAAMIPIGDDLLDRLLAEDSPFGDLTTAALGIGERPGRMSFEARVPMVVCGLEEAVRLIGRAGATATAHHRGGTAVAAGTRLLDAAGPAATLHRAWKVAQTLVEALSGIASDARAIVEAAHRGNPEARVACTRKSFPGTKALALLAIVAGGAVPHRLGLSETVLMFPEHRLFLPPDEPLAVTVARLRANCPERTLVAEATTIADALALARAGVTVVQLEKLAPAQVREVAAAVDDDRLPTVIAAAGGIGPNNAEAYAAAGARVLVTSRPYLASPRDVQVRFQAA
jgi:molybdenum transport protein